MVDPPRDGLGPGLLWHLCALKSQSLMSFKVPWCPTHFKVCEYLSQSIETLECGGNSIYNI